MLRNAVARLEVLLNESWRSDGAGEDGLVLT